MIWVYAICDPREVSPPLETLPVDGFAAVIRRLEHAPPAPTPDVLWAHERVVEQLMDDRALLPMRFGTCFADEAELRAALEARTGELQRGLDRVRGRVELSVRALGAANAPARDGREYLHARLAGSREATAVHDPLAALAVSDLRRPTRGSEVLRAAYLVDRSAVPRFRATVEELQRAELRQLLCTGPWPPYSFT